MSAVKPRLDDLIVVDAELEDYESLVASLICDGVRVHLFSTGEAALRAAQTRRVAFWIVNLQLPDMSGIGLLKLVRRRMGRSIVFLVGNEYSAQDELTARTAGATAYVCKPPTVTWLAAYETRCRSPTIRASPAVLPSREDP